MLNEQPTERYKVPIWLSNWIFKYNKGTIFINKKIVNKVVKKIIGVRKKHTLVPVNLTLVSQHGFGIED